MTKIANLVTMKANELITWIDDNTPQGLNALGQGVIKANYTKAGASLDSSTY